MKLKKVIKHINDNTLIGLYFEGNNVYNGQRKYISNDFINYNVDTIWTGTCMTGAGHVVPKINVDLKI